jgi:phosphatidylglycerol:prolipoprotein diacylglycerol transferase
MNFLAYLVMQPHPFLWRWGWAGGNEWGIRYYSLVYLNGFCLLFLALRWQAQRGWSRLRGEAIVDFTTWASLGGIVLGGRLGYCLLYAPRDLFANPLSLFTVWKGGMASHGGIAGVIIVMILFARSRKIPFYNLADAVALPAPLALGLGRCANFLNGELWGRPSTVPWAMVFPQAPLVHGVNVPRHPSQLYEALLEGVVLQLLLIALRLRATREGAVALSFMAGYPVLRIAGEQFREPDEQIGFWFRSITQGQLLSALMLLVTLGLAWHQFVWRPRSETEIRRGEPAAPTADESASVPSPS